MRVHFLLELRAHTNSYGTVNVTISNFIDLKYIFFKKVVVRNNNNNNKVQSF